MEDRSSPPSSKPAKSDGGKQKKMMWGELYYPEPGHNVLKSTNGLRGSKEAVKQMSSIDRMTSELERCMLGDGMKILRKIAVCNFGIQILIRKWSKFSTYFTDINFRKILQNFRLCDSQLKMVLNCQMLGTIRAQSMGASSNCVCASTNTAISELTWRLLKTIKAFRSGGNNYSLGDVVLIGSKNMMKIAVDLNLRGFPSILHR